MTAPTAVDDPLTDVDCSRELEPLVRLTEVGEATSNRVEKQISAVRFARQWSLHAHLQQNHRTLSVSNLYWICPWCLAQELASRSTTFKNICGSIGETEVESLGVVKISVELL